MRTFVVSIFAVLVFSGHLGFGQSPVKNTATFNFSVDSVAEKLVLLALNNPRIRIAEKAVDISAWDYSRTKTAWTNNIVLTGNLNEYTVNQTFGQDDPIGNRYFPRYNFGVSLPLGLFVNNPKATKAARGRYESTLASVEVEKQTIRREVLTLYENYLTQRQLLLLQQELMIDARKHFESQELSFKEGKIVFERYLAASKTFNTEQVKELNLTNDLRIIEIRIEELIGMRLDDALRQFMVQN